MSTAIYLVSQCSHKPDVYRWLTTTAAQFCDEQVSVHLANYRTAYQLSLDGNQPGETIHEHRRTARMAALMLACRLNHLLTETPVVPPEDF